MKKILSVFLMTLVLVATLSACKSKEATKTYVSKENPSSETVVTYEGKDVKKISINDSHPISEGENLEDTKKSLEELKKAMPQVEGIVYNFDVTEKEVKTSMEMDITKLSQENLEKILGSEQKLEDLKNLEKVEEELKKQGYEEKK